MQRFFHFVLVLLITGIVVGLAVLTVSSNRSENRRRESLRDERSTLGQFLSDIQDRVRRADVVVESQTIAGDGHVISTTLLFCPTGWDAAANVVPVAARRIIIDGDRVAIDAVKLDFPDGVFEDGYLKGLSLTMFVHVYAADQPPTNDPKQVDTDLLDIWGSVHPGFRPINPAKPHFSSEFEQHLWSTIGDYMINDKLAARQNVQRTWFPPLIFTARPGHVYHVALGAYQQLTLDEQEDSKGVADLLERAPSTSEPADADQ